MADMKFTEQAEQPLESLMEEIVTTASNTQKLLRMSPTADSLEEAELHIALLSDALNRVGWLADVGLTKSGSLQKVHNGNPFMWMVSRDTASNLGGQHV